MCKTPDHPFIYGPSRKISRWGFHFDSLLELKYAFSIDEEYEFLRSRITIYYKHGTLQPVTCITQGIRHYTPDFLIRHRQTGKAFLVEIKPRKAADDPRLLLRKRIAENFILWKGYDWNFKIIYDDEIILDEEMLKLFRACQKLKSSQSIEEWIVDQNARYGKHAPQFFTKTMRERDIRFILSGER